VFGSAQYAPTTPAGQWLLAHELAHVVQQTAAALPPQRLSLGRSNDAYEQEADQVATQVTVNPHGSLRIQRSTPAATVQRFSTSEHQRIGEAAYSKAYAQVQAIPSGQPAPALDAAFVSNLRNFRFRTASQRTLNYGELVAIADDIASFELLEEREQRRAGRGIRIPLLSPVWDWIGDKTHYLDLASRNRAHFHPHNFLAWQPWHWQALHIMHQAWQYSEQANGLKREVRMLLQRFDQHNQQGRQAIAALDAITTSGVESPRAAELEQTIEREVALMQALLQEARSKQQQYQDVRTQASNLALRAMAMNGFGDHFLTDAFSAGHIVTPRHELLREYSTRLLGFIPVGGVLHCVSIPSLAWHDLDNKFGVQVNNSNGVQWLTYGDDYADEETLPGGRSLSPTMQHAVDATATSIGQMWQAAGGQLPADLLPVLNQLPRPNLDAYPRWTPSDWELQLRHAAGEQVGATYDPFTSSPRPSAQPSEEVPNPRGEQVGSGPLSARATCLNLMSKFNYEDFVVPMLARIRSEYAERFFTGQASQIVSPDTKPVAQESVTGNVVLGSLIGTAAGVGLGLLIGGLIGGGLALALGGVLGGLVGFLGGGFISGFLGQQRGESSTRQAAARR
jgi:hypothetical protein